MAAGRMRVPIGSGSGPPQHHDDQLPERSLEAILADLDDVTVHAQVVDGGAWDRAARSCQFRGSCCWATSTMRRHLVPSGSVRVTTTLTRAIVPVERKPGKDRRATLALSANSVVTVAAQPAPSPRRRNVIPLPYYRACRAFPDRPGLLVRCGSRGHRGSAPDRPCPPGRRSRGSEVAQPLSGGSTYLSLRRAAVAAAIPSTTPAVCV